MHTQPRCMRTNTVSTSIKGPLDHLRPLQVLCSSENVRTPQAVRNQVSRNLNLIDSSIASEFAQTQLPLRKQAVREERARLGRRDRPNLARSSLTACFLRGRTPLVIRVASPARRGFDRSGF